MQVWQTIGNQANISNQIPGGCCQSLVEINSLSFQCCQFAELKGWSWNSLLDRMFGQLQRERMVRIRVEAYGLDSTGIKAHPAGAGALKETIRSPSADPGAAGIPDLMWLPQMVGQPLPSRSPPAMHMTPRRGAQTAEPADTSGVQSCPTHGPDVRRRRYPPADP